MLFEQEKEQVAEIQGWSTIEEQVLKKKSRPLWITCGDSNSKYFHAQWKIKNSHNTITSIYTEVGLKLTDPILIEEEFIALFSPL